jgi:hypothetical protein
MSADRPHFIYLVWGLLASGRLKPVAIIIVDFKNKI